MPALMDEAFETNPDGALSKRRWRVIFDRHAVGRELSSMTSGPTRLPGARCRSPRTPDLAKDPIANQLRKLRASICLLGYQEPEFGHLTLFSNLLHSGW